MRKDPLVTGEYYHIYNRGVDKRDIFMNKRDLNRFILSVKKFNTTKPIGSIRESLEQIHEHRQRYPMSTLNSLSSGVGHLKNPESDSKLVSIVCYCFNPNHFHFILKQEADGGISEFFKRLGGYTNYFNLIHQRSGSLFQGKFKSHLINSDRYFLKIYPYVNMNYAVHTIPKEKSHLVWASDREYSSGSFDIVSKQEAKHILDLYGTNQNFKRECLETISIIRKERGRPDLKDKDLLP